VPLEEDAHPLVQDGHPIAPRSELPVAPAKRQLARDNPMENVSFTRRHFLTTASAVAAATLLPLAARAADKKAATRWPIGCFNRPWTKWPYEQALDAIKAAGYEWTGLLTPTPSRGEVFTSANATPEYLASIKQQIAARNLKLNMTALRVRNELPLADAIADTRKQIENAKTVGVQYALTFGEAKAERYAQYYKVMADIAAFAQERGIKLVMKPHGGGSGSSEEIRTAIKAVGHPNFKIWYDAGNIIFYTGKDPVAELEPIAEHVTGFCAKDCAKQKGDVMIQFGEGAVDFAGVFKKLKSAGFDGPIMVECCKIGATPQETMENARANRLFLEKVLASV
jgi:sugar phosphate isomerase/epimerase